MPHDDQIFQSSASLGCLVEFCLDAKSAPFVEPDGDEIRFENFESQLSEAKNLMANSDKLTGRVSRMAPPLVRRSDPNPEPSVARKPINAIKLTKSNHCFLVVNQRPPEFGWKDSNIESFEPGR